MLEKRRGGGVDPKTATNITQTVTKNSSSLPQSIFSFFFLFENLPRQIVAQSQSENTSLAAIAGNRPVCRACSDRPTVYNIYYVGIINCNMGQIHFRTCGHFSSRCSPSSSCLDVCLGGCKDEEQNRRRRRRRKSMPVRQCPRPFQKKGIKEC